MSAESINVNVDKHLQPWLGRIIKTQNMDTNYFLYKDEILKVTTEKTISSH